MKVTTFVRAESFVYQAELNSDTAFQNALQHLDSIVDYLNDLEDPEVVYYSNEMFEQEVLPGMTVMDCYYIEEDDPLHDQKDLLQRTIGNMKPRDKTTEADQCIKLNFYPALSMGEETENIASDLPGYLTRRRELLITIAEIHEFSVFMKTCFADIVFSNNIENDMRDIHNFSTEKVRKAIVHDLAILNDEALSIYDELYPDLKKIYGTLNTKVLACSPESNHNESCLYFDFSYQPEGQPRQVKSVLCSPHTKLLRRDSDLRIYFTWRDKDIGPNKVLVGRIGRHPYSKFR